MKRLLALAVSLVLIWAPSALAAPGDAVPFRRGVGGMVEIQSAAVIGDTVYVGAYSDMYAYKLGDEKPTRLACERPDDMDMRGLFASDGALYALMQTWGEKSGCRLVRVTVDESGAAKLGEMLELDWSEMRIEDGEYSYSREYDNPVAIDGTLYLMAMSEDWNTCELFAFNMADGSYKKLNAPHNTNAIARYKDGKLLSFERERHDNTGPVTVAVINPQTGEHTQAAAFEIDSAEVYGLAYDEQTDSIFYVAGGSVHQVKGMDFKNAQVVSDMPLGNNSAMLRAGQLITGQYYMYYNYEALIIRNLAPDARPERTLTIKGYYQADDAYYAFAAAHPEVAVSILNSYMPDEEVTRAMMDRDGTSDIFILDLDGPAFQALIGRGYLAEVTHAKIIKGMSRMYPAIRDAVTVNGKLVAVPQSFSSYGVMGLSMEVMKKLGLTEETLPRTWIEMIDFIEGFSDKYGEAFPEVTPLDPASMPRIRETLLNWIVGNYLSSKGGQGMLSLNDPVLRKTLERLDAADFSSTETEESEDGYTWSSGTVLFSGWTHAGFDGYRYRDDITWPMAFENGKAPALPLTFTAFVINPFSGNRDIAEEYLSLTLEKMNVYMKTTLCPDVNEPLRDDYYEQNMREMQRWLEKARAELEKAPPEDKAIYEENVRSAEANIKDYEKEAWAASAEDIAKYRKLAENLTVVRYMGLGSSNAGEIDALLGRYAAKQIPMDQFISGIDQKISMAMMEGM